MTVEYEPTSVESGYNLSAINENFEKVKEAFKDAFSKSGNTPNQMESDLDMDGNDILNADNLHVGGSLVLQGKTVTPAELVEGSYKDIYENIVDAISNDDLTVGQIIYTVKDGNWVVVADGTYTADSKVVYDLTGTSGQVVSLSTVVESESDLDADIRLDSVFETDAIITIKDTGNTYRKALATATDHHRTTSGGVKLYEAGLNYTTRDRFVQSVARGDSFRVGEQVTAEGCNYLFLDDASTDIPDLVAWGPVAPVKVQHFGVSTDASEGDNSDAMDDAITWLSSADNQTLEWPEGVYNLSRSLIEITGTGNSLIGSGFSTNLRLPTTASVAEFLKIGDGTNTTARIVVGGFQLTVRDTSTVQTGFAIEVDDASDVSVKNIRGVNIVGMLNVGETDFVNRLDVKGLYGTWRDDHNHRIIKAQRFTDFGLSDVKIFGSETAARTVPTVDFTVVGLCDTLRWDRVEMWTRSGSSLGILIDGDNGSFVNATFEDMVLDKTGNGNAAVLIRQTASCAADVNNFFKIQKVKFVRFRADTGGDNAGGKAVQINQAASTGYARIQGINFTDCILAARDDVSITTTKTGTDRLDSVSVIGGEIGDAASVTVASMIDIGSDGVSVIGVHANFNEQTESASFTNFIRTTNADIENLVVMGNIVTSCANLISEVSYTTPNLSSRVIKGNSVLGGIDGHGVETPKLIVKQSGGTVTISSGALPVPEYSRYKVNTEGSVSTDDLDTIGAGTFDGQVLRLEPLSEVRDVVIRDGTGNISLTSGDFILTSRRDFIELFWNDTFSEWVEDRRADNS